MWRIVVVAVIGIATGVVTPAIGEPQTGSTLTNLLAVQQHQIAALQAAIDNLNQQTVPIGSIIAWHGDLSDDLALPDDYVPCDGREITVGILAGQKTPDLNGKGLFLRGAEQSGEEQQDQLQDHGHRHSLQVTDEGSAHRHRFPTKLWSQPTNRNIGSPGLDNYSGFNENNWPAHTRHDGTQTDGKHTHGLAGSVDTVISAGDSGAARVGQETRPVNMAVIWVMRVR